MLFKLPPPPPPPTPGRYYVFEAEEQEAAIKGIQPLFAGGN